MKMKELEARTGVGREAIRFYLREGMLPEPERPKRNVARYGEEHVQRLFAIRKLKEERFLPLAMIKSVLASDEYRQILARQPLAGIELLLPTLVDGVGAGGNRTVDDVSASSGIDHDEIAALDEQGSIEIRRGDGDRRWLDSRDAAIVEQWGKLRRAGFTARRGYHVERLREYETRLREIASDEVARFVDAFADTDLTAAAELGARGIELVNEMLALVHTRAVIDVMKARFAPER